MISNLFKDSEGLNLEKKAKILNSDEPPIINKSSGLDINEKELKSSNIIDKSMYSEIIGTSNQL